MSRKYLDCRELPNEVGCTLRISGEETELLEASAEHAVSVHQETDSAELRALLRRSMREEERMGQNPRPEPMTHLSV